MNKKDLYHLIIAGNPTESTLQDVKHALIQSLSTMGLSVDKNVRLDITPTHIETKGIRTTAALFFGSGSSQSNSELAQQLVEHQVSIIPVVTELNKVSSEIPECLRHLNCLEYSKLGAHRAVSALLEGVGLLPEQRQIFLSYRREESRDAALQLYEALSSKGFHVFLDTHSISMGAKFQDTLWHELCRSDVLLMLDTKGYFDSRWAIKEFGRAMAKQISILRVGWPNVEVSDRAQTAKTLQLDQNHFLACEKKLTDVTLQYICDETEIVRSKSYAFRRAQLLQRIRNEVEKTAGKFLSVGVGSGAHLRLIDGTEIIAYPSIGIPSSLSLHNAELNSGDIEPVVVYDHIGLLEGTKEHIKWLGSRITTCKWLRVSDADWKFAAWEE